MEVPVSSGRVSLNAEGKRYTAVFRIERSAIIVTFGSVSRIVEVGEIVSPESIARTVLRTMVKESPAAAASADSN